MSIGYNVIQPNGIVRKLRAVDDIDRRKIVDELQRKWEAYCLQNWITWSNDPYTPENRVKLFLNGISYFLIVGNTEGVVTDYKDIMNGKREIPISSCPACVEDAVYGGGSTICPSSQDEMTRFDQMLEKLDKRADKLKKTVKKKTSGLSSKSERLKRIRSQHKGCRFVYPVVDTDNCFTLNGDKYRISDKAIQYSAKNTCYGELYDMDHIVCVISNDGIDFYDTDINKQPDEWIIKENF